MRVFVAVFPPRATQEIAARAIDALRGPGDGVSWVKPGNLHYTLRFIGEVGADGARRVAEAAREAATGLAPFEAVLGAPGAFPKPRDARVLWIGLAAGADPFRLLARRLESALEQRGWDRERQPFKPHLTIGRVRQAGRDWTDALAAAGSLEADPAARFEVGAVACVESTLSPQGSTYRTYEAAPLRP